MPTIKPNPWVWMLPALVLGAADDAPDAATAKADSLLKDFTEVRSFREDGPPLLRVWRKAGTRELILELSPDTEGKPLFVVPTVAAGDPEAGVYSVFHRAVQRQAQHVVWRRINDRVALIVRDHSIRTSGDHHSRRALERIRRDRVVASAAILADGPGKGPLLDLDALLLNDAHAFFGGFVKQADPALATLDAVKVFPRNIELRFALPVADGTLAQLHYSIGAPPSDPDYRPVEADRRVGIYYVHWDDSAKHDGVSRRRRYASRWKLEKADPGLRLSPPRQPIVYYLEHTTPVRYRKWVREGALSWNKAFERIGIVHAIEVRQQDDLTGAHMDKDPEDMRYSFIRWTTAPIGYALGPRHYNPETGQIFEADIILAESFLRSWTSTLLERDLAAAAMFGLPAELDAWLAAHPRWDPRVRFARPVELAETLRWSRALSAGDVPGGEPPATMRPEVWSAHRRPFGLPQLLCLFQTHASMGAAMLRDMHDVGLLPAGGSPAKTDDLDGLPEDFVGPLLAHVVAHEVGHTLGLMHNWKGSSVYAFADINSTRMKGTRTMSGSVMDYVPDNVVVEGDGLIQGDYTPIDVGPYDMWAIEWSYTDGDREAIARRAAEPELAFSAEEGQNGPDPHAKMWDLGSDSLAYAAGLVELARTARRRLIERAVADNESWQRARDMHVRLMAHHQRALTIAAGWVGGAHVNKFRKGDPGAPAPIRPVDVETQRRALRFVLENAFRQEAFGLTPELLSRLVADQWYDEGYTRPQSYPAHDHVLAVQAATLTLLVNPTRLRWVLDNELRAGPDADALTLAELLETLRKEIWTVDASAITTMRRNLQREHLDRMIDIAIGTDWPGASGHAVRAVARHELRAIRSRVEELLADATTADVAAHLTDVRDRTDRALDAVYTLQP